MRGGERESRADTVTVCPTKGPERPLVTVCQPRETPGQSVFNQRPRETLGHSVSAQRDPWPQCVSPERPLATVSPKRPVATVSETSIDPERTWSPCVSP